MHTHGNTTKTEIYNKDILRLSAQKSNNIIVLCTTVKQSIYKRQNHVFAGYRKYLIFMRVEKLFYNIYYISY